MQHGSFVRQTRSQTRLTQNATDRGSQPISSDDAQVRFRNDGDFEPSVIDVEHGGDYECTECTRPNNAEMYMVQCGVCKHWYHFSCAKVDKATVRAKDFICVKCLPKVHPPPASSRAGQSSTSSARRAQIARDLQKLEDERCLREKLEEERLQIEKLLIEKAINEKLERETEYLARKHELLRQQDEDLVSVRSGRSSRSQASSRQKVEAWIKHQQMSTDGGPAVDSSSTGFKPQDHQQMPPEQAGGPAGSSTPLEISELSDRGHQRIRAGITESVPRTTDSISIGDSPVIEDGCANQPLSAQQCEVERQVNVPKLLPLVNIHPYVRLLDDNQVQTSSDIARSANTQRLPRIVPKLRACP
nr:uncharacterized protein LOC115266388 [Aedes albopictus]